MSLHAVDGYDEVPDHVLFAGEPDAPVSVVSPVSDTRAKKGDQSLARLLDDLDSILARFVAFPSPQARHAVAAWIVHAHAIDAFASTPRLAVLSPEKGSGKTRVMEMLELLVPCALLTVNISPAALFRKIDEGRVTILLDEADTYLGTKVAKEHEELRGLVNAGHRRGAVAFRCSIAGKGVEVVEFPAYAPVALAGIGDLPDTILDRSIVVAMKRRAPHEVVEAFRHRKVVTETEPIRERLSIWAKANADALSLIEPDMPEGITDRPADVWEPLVMLGDYAGDGWSEAIRSAATFLNGQRERRDPSLGIKLLADCRTVFAATDADRIQTADLVAALVALDESPWGDLRGNELDARGLAWRLRPYEVRPGQHRFAEVTKKGYLRSDFVDAWARYLPRETETPETSETDQP
jgi:hypothetical protein